MYCERYISVKGQEIGEKNPYPVCIIPFPLPKHHFIMLGKNEKYFVDKIFD